ncbi:hypothetical protein V496_04155 [Pseudogymnoascus sp. VKM F-4515 (FW-2607)]|nr:hypothetical protein V496_04155 [Pseudogymnoascus sp. VKM F-4515 (FW-2607)]KFY92307.1 hypothetical protein V498_05049 [Pseudogymnoascus sp. VKM F-4517 (FW-2822)]
MVKATMPEEHHDRFQPKSRFPGALLKQADEELDGLVNVLEKEGVKVFRPKHVDWYDAGGYTAAMPRDGLITVGNTIIEAPFSWGCRKREIDLAYSGLLAKLEQAGQFTIIRAPKIIGADTIYNDVGQLADGAGETKHNWAINNSRPAFDAADFMRFGKVLIGQYSHVTNCRGVEYLRACIPNGYTVEVLDVNDPHAMHIDATILPLKHGLLVYNPLRTSEIALRKHTVLRDWDIWAYPFVPKKREHPPLYMTSEWLCMNVLSISECKVIVEEKDKELAEWVRQFGIEPIPVPFQHVHAIGGSFHCATVDLVRDDIAG